jgi:hypothetical protein
MTPVKVLDFFTTAYALRKTLGDGPNYFTLLLDMRRGRSDFHGLVLLPIGRTREGRSLRPVYAVEDVVLFIKKAREVAEVPANPAAVKVRTVMLDPEDYRSWRVRKVPSAASYLTEKPKGIPR